MNQITPIAQGLQVGLGLTHFKRLEDSVRAGANEYLTSLCQVGEVRFATVHAEMALEFVGVDPLPLALRTIVYLSPVLVALGIKWLGSKEKLRLTFVSIQEAIGNFCQLAALVSSLALIYFGSVVLGSVSLGIIALGYLDRRALLPERVRHLIHDYSLPVLTVMGLTFGSTLDILFSLVNITAICFEKYLAWKEMREITKIANSEIKEGVLTPQLLKEIVEDRLSLEVNPDYIHYQTLPLTTPSIDYECMNELFDQIDWKDHIAALRKKFFIDQRFRKLEGDPTGKPDDFLVNYARKNLTEFLSCVKNHTITNGEPRDYKTMEIYLKFIANHVKHATNSIDRVDPLLRLAVEGGGEYCGPGKFEVAESIFASIVYEGKDMTRTKVLNALQDSRNHWAQALYDFTSKTQPVMGKVIDWHDVHTYNQMVNAYAHNLGLRKSGADNDSSAVIDSFTRLFLSKIFNLESYFWQFHTVEEVVSTVSSSIDSYKITYSEYVEWWQQWVNRQQPPDLKDELESDFCLFGKNLSTVTLKNDKKRYVPQPEFVAAMLLDMGVLRVSKSKQLPQQIEKPALGIAV